MNPPKRYLNTVTNNVIPLSDYAFGKLSENVKGILREVKDGEPFPSDKPVQAPKIVKEKMVAPTTEPAPETKDLPDKKPIKINQKLNDIDNLFV